MQTLTIKRENGNIAKSLPGQDHISGLLFLVADAESIPAEFETTRFRPCSSEKSMDDLGLTTTDQFGYHVYEALRTCPGITLWVGFAVRTQDMKAVGDMQRAAGGNIRQIGVLDSANEISQQTVTALQAQAALLDEAWMPLSIIVAPKVLDVTTLPTNLAASAPNVSVLISRDSEATAPAIGTLIGILAARAVNESIAWVERCETGLTRPLFSDGTAYADTDKALLETLDNARYIYLRTYPGLSGVFFSDSHNMDSPQSEYCSIELQRTMDKAVRGTRSYLLPELGRPIFFNTDGTLRADTLQHLKTVAGTPATTVVVGTVTRADSAHVDIQPLDPDSPPLLDINLHVSETAALAFQPAVGALVVALLDSPTSGFVISSSRGKILLNGGDNGPLVKIDELQKNLDALKDYVLAMNNAIIAGITAVGASPTASGTNGAQAYQQQMASRSISFADMADTSVSH